MKAKLAMLLLAAMGSTALVASAQTPSYSITTVRSADVPDVVPPVPPRPPVAAMQPIPAPPGARPFVARPYSAVYFNDFGETGLSHQAEQLAQQLAAAKSDSDRDKIKAQLSDLLEKQFGERQKRHEEEIKQLEAQVKKLRDLVEKRQENRREIIARRLDQIVKEAQGLGW